MKDISGTTRICGLIGNPVEHTKSPIIHNTLAEELGIDLCYGAFRVDDDKVEDAIKGAYALNILGMNVTVPYKSRVIASLSDIDPLAKKIGAVNTLVRTEGGFKGYNTDMPGLYRAMCYDGVDIRNEKVVILGAGGVARAVLMMLIEKGAKEIVIVNRTIEKAREIMEEAYKFADRERQSIKAVSVEEFISDASDKEYIAIQATSVGMYPNVDCSPCEDPSFYEKVKAGYDLIFNPEETLFMKMVRESGGKAYNGLKMLLYQGIIAFELWTGEKVSDDLADKILQKMKHS
ncbi:MAG: shikimate dehydrogenase [Lachnospiraceae bacterium]|nr:shikimate dehydrogenase [Lachnospiraceae bacterium]